MPIIPTLRSLKETKNNHQFEASPGYIGRILSHERERDTKNYIEFLFCFTWDMFVVARLDEDPILLLENTLKIPLALGLFFLGFVSPGKNLTVFSPGIYKPGCQGSWSSVRIGGRGVICLILDFELMTWRILVFCCYYI
jgi:hypothetical protein